MEVQRVMHSSGVVMVRDGGSGSSKGIRVRVVCKGIRVRVACKGASKGVTHPSNHTLNRYPSTDTLTRLSFRGEPTVRRRTGAGTTPIHLQTLWKT